MFGIGICEVVTGATFLGVETWKVGVPNERFTGEGYITENIIGDYIKTDQQQLS